MNIMFISGFGPIIKERESSRQLYLNRLGITFKEDQEGYLHTEALDGAKTFALWPLALAARSCFGSKSWPSDVPVPQAWVEFEVDVVESATRELESQGLHMLVRNQTEPWGQTVSRFLSPEGILVGITCTPALRPAT